MAKKSASPVKSRRAPNKAGQNDGAETLERFDRAFGIIESAVTGSMISGITPYSFEPILSYWFLRTAAGTRGQEESEFERWISETGFIFDKIVDSVIDAFDESETGEGLNPPVEIDEGELADFLAFRETLNTSELSELDLRRQNKIAISVMDWVLEELSRDGELEMLLVELALFIQWFRVAALAGDIEPELFLRVKSEPNRMFEAYVSLIQ